MSKLSKQIQNPCFPEEFAEYLEANGFLKSDNDIFNRTYMKDDRAVVITADRASFRFYNAHEDDHSDIEFAEVSSFHGLSSLVFMDWVFLLHAVKMIHINQSLNNYRRTFKKTIDLKIKQPEFKAANVVQLAENIFGSVKTIMVVFIVSLLTIAFNTSAQASISMRAGYSFKTSDVLIAPAVTFTLFDKISVGPEIMVNTKRDAPVNFGIKASYQYKFLEAGVGGWYQLYSTDHYDSYKNGFAGSGFVAAHWKLFFLQWEYLTENKVAVGIREPLND